MSDQPVASPGVPAAPTVTLDPNPDKMSPAKAKAEARKLRAQDGWTVAELKRRYGSRWSTDWLEGIAAPVSSLSAKQQEKKDALASKPKKEQPVTETAKPEPTSKPKPSGAAGSRPDASKPKPAPRSVSKAQAARESVARAKAAKAAAEKAKDEATLDAAAAKAAKNTKPKATGKGTQASGKRVVKAGVIVNDAVRLIRSLYGDVPNDKISARVKAEYSVDVNSETLDKIGKRVIRADVPDVPRKAKVS